MSPICPRCGSGLGTFILDGTEALSCDACGYVGVEANHSGEPTVVESWEEAINRFEQSLRDSASAASNGDSPAEDDEKETDHEEEAEEAEAEDEEQAEEEDVEEAVDPADEGADRANEPATDGT